MNYVSKLRPELVDDLAEAFYWYEKRAEGLGHDLVRNYFAALATVERNPETFLKVHSDFRRALLPRFPYALYFRIENNVIVFVLLFPCVRNPRLLRKQLRARQE